MLKAPKKDKNLKKTKIDENSLAYQSFLANIAQKEIEKGTSRKVSKTALLALLD